MTAFASTWSNTIMRLESFERLGMVILMITWSLCVSMIYIKQGLFNYGILNSVP